MPNKLSHSSVSRFQACPKSYEYHYVKRIRTQLSPSSLLFGSALDNGLNDLLLGKTTAKKTFEDAFTFAEINGVRTFLPTHPDLIYANADFDDELLTEDNWNVLKQTYGPIDFEDSYMEIMDKKKASGFEGLDTKEKVLYNHLNWFSLLRKGFLMIEAYEKKVLPRINKVLAIQEQAILENEDGDQVTGYVDLVADVKDYGPVILDNKTSAMEYEADSVISSPQLSLYVNMLGKKYNTRKAGYIVLRKSIIKNRTKTCSVCGHDGTGGRHKSCDNTIEGKRCGGSWKEAIKPEVSVQFIVDEIPEKTEEIVVDNIIGINDAIKHGHFNRNLSTCTNYYGSYCPYYKLCYKDDFTGLINLNETNTRKN